MKPELVDLLGKRFAFVGDQKDEDADRIAVKSLLCYLCELDLPEDVKVNETPELNLLRKNIPFIKFIDVGVQKLGVDMTDYPGTNDTDFLSAKVRCLFLW